jgi:hypothetical protein
VTRPRLAFLRSFAYDVARRARRTSGRRPLVEGSLGALRRRSSPTPPPPGDDRADRTADEFARRLDETRERLRREIPPRDDQADH